MDYQSDNIVSVQFLSGNITASRNPKRPMLLSTNLSGMEFGSTNKAITYTITRGYLGLGKCKKNKNKKNKKNNKINK